METYIHYGSNKFDINAFNKIENHRLYPKPKGGLWASNVNSKYGWKEYCSEYDIDVLCDYSYSFTFNLLDNARIINIHTVSDFNNIYKKYKRADIEKEYNLKILDYEMMAKDYDVIDFLLTNDNRLYSLMTYWDCDSILVLNPNVIVY